MTRKRIFTPVALLSLLLILLFPQRGNFAATVAPKFKVLAFYSTGNGYLGRDDAHISFAHESNAFFPKLGADSGFSYDSTMAWDKLNDQAYLSGYQVLIFLDDQPAPAEFAGFQKYMENGGAVMIFHVCAYHDNSMAKWSWYNDTLLGGGNFKSNTWWPTTAQWKVEDNAHPATKGFPSLYKSEVSEWYSWDNDIRKNPNIHILCSIDPSSFPLGTDPNQSWTSGYYPVVWTNTKYKMFYCNSGHNYMDYTANKALSFTWSNAQHVTLTVNALRWLAGESTAPVQPGGDRFHSRYSDDMRIDLSHPAVRVSRFGLDQFGVSILDLQGNVISEGRANHGLFSTEALRARKGLYVVRTSSASGDESKVITLR